MYRGAPGYGTPRSRPYDTLARLLLRCEAPPAAALADSLLPRPPPPVADARTWRQQPHDSDCLGSGAPSGLGLLAAGYADLRRCWHPWSAVSGTACASAAEEKERELAGDEGLNRKGVTVESGQGNTMQPPVSSSIDLEGKT